jgi:hypothetical protein
MVWCFVRYFIPRLSGRKCFNVLGAVDSLTKEFGSTVQVVQSWHSGRAVSALLVVALVTMHQLYC